MQITTRQILQVLHALSWIIFSGFVLKAGGMLFSTIYTFFFGPEGAKEFLGKNDLPGLYNYDRSQFLVIAIHMIIPAVLRCILF